ncbi:MAG: hypothetical protein ACE5KD_04605 [Candidatus Bathyarchaeia archaeon]
MAKKKENKPADEALHTEEAQTTFSSKINKWGFIHLNKQIRNAWGITKGTEQTVTIELTAEGSLIIRKA